MFKHSLLLSFRNFKKFRSSFFINLIGLSTGLTSVLLIYLWVHDELSVDQFHAQKDRLYWVMENHVNSNGINTEKGSPGGLAEALVVEMPEVEMAATVLPTTWYPNSPLSVGDKKIRATGQVASKDYFRIFSFPLLDGEKTEVLANKNNIVISETLALSLFNTTEGLVGKTVKFQQDQLYQVSGVFRNQPANSSTQFDFIIPFAGFREENPWILEWGSSGPRTFVVLKEGADLDAFNSKIKGFLSTKGDHGHRSLFATPFAEDYLRGNYENGHRTGGRITYVRLFSVVALFILLIACINFMNLSTAKASRRLKEIGVKKAIGASRSQLIYQYLGESVIMSMIALVLALLLTVSFLPTFNEITGKQLSMPLEVSFGLIALGIALLTGLLAGSYPALYLSGFKPVNILKGQGLSNSLHQAFGVLVARRGLVVFQFTMAVVLIVAVLVVYQQIQYIQNKNLGYNKENILHFYKEGAVDEKSTLFLNELKALPGVKDASASSHALMGHQNSTTGLEWEGKQPDEMIGFEYIDVDYGMLEILGLEILEGRSFSNGYGKDSSAIILNEAAAKAMGLTDPVGKRVYQWGEEKQVIGVVKNFHFQTFHEKVKPLFFALNPEDAWRVMVKVEGGRTGEALEGIRQLYQRFNPEFPFHYSFLDQEYQVQYTAEQRIATLSRYFAGIAILISCLGLWGLTAFAAEQRRKEIGIRKVLGASIGNIMSLLSKDFIYLVGIAILVGSTLSRMVMSAWLDSFAYRIELSWWIFMLAGTAAFLIAFFTVSYQGIKAAMANPVRNLRTE